MHAAKSKAALLVSQGSEAWSSFLAGLSPDALRELPFDWPFWGRQEQLAPSGDWDTWVVLAGRGFGKTRTGAEWIREIAETKQTDRIALVAPTAADSRDVMVEGESGILAISRPNFRPLYEPSKRRLTWPNGVQATTYSADEPNRLRGPQHGAAWADELAAWRYPEAWDMLRFGLRLGARPRAIVTTTPRPIAVLRKLLAEAGTVTTRGATYDNAANLAPSFLQQVLRQYEGTRLGRQELHAEILDDAPGALWKRAQIDALRVAFVPDEVLRTVVAIDPAVSTGGESAETGIVVVCVAMCGCKGKPEKHGFVLDDLSGRLSPDAWASAAVGAYRFRHADRIVGEVNNGGNLVEANIRTVDGLVPYEAVHASQGKHTRAEPVAALYEQGRVHHVGSLPYLEDQMCTWEPLTGQRSPDRMDAAVWGLSKVMFEHVASVGFSLPRSIASRRE